MVMPQSGEQKLVSGNRQHSKLCLWPGHAVVNNFHFWGHRQHKANSTYSKVTVSIQKRVSVVMPQTVCSEQYLQSDQRQYCEQYLCSGHRRYTVNSIVVRPQTANSEQYLCSDNSQCTVNSICGQKTFIVRNQTANVSFGYRAITEGWITSVATTLQTYLVQTKASRLPDSFVIIPKVTVWCDGTGIWWQANADYLRIDRREPG